MAAKRLLLIAPLALIVLLAIGLVPRWVTGAPAQAPSQPVLPQGITIPYAGRLTDAAGQPVADGAYDFTFSLYAAERDGDRLWGETQTALTVQGGSFIALLGSSVPIPKEVGERDTLWLAVQVRGPAEAAFTALEGRQRLRSAEASPDLQASCAHDHFGEQWIGTSADAGLVVYNQGTGDGLRGVSFATASNYAGVYGVNYSSGPGVYGLGNGGGPGVSGYSSGRGVYGSGADGVVGESYVSGMSGVYGLNTDVAGYGVTGRCEGNFGVFAWGNDTSLDDAAGDILLQGNYGEIFSYGTYLDLFTNDSMYVDLDHDNNTAYSSFQILDGAENPLWTIQEPSGDVVAAGTQASVAKTAKAGQRLLYAVEATGAWVEDIGTARLVDGELTVAYDPIYVQTVNLQGDYQLFITAQSDQPVLLYVSAKTPTGFTVRGVTLDGKPANCTFDYRVVAERLGYEDTRLEQYVPPSKAEVQP